MTVLRTLTGRARCPLRLVATFVVVACAMAFLALPSRAKAASYDVTVAVPVEVSCPASVQGSPEFTFEMVPQEGAPQISPLKVSCTNGKGSGAFSAHFDALGTYRYTLRQTGAAPLHWTYDGGQWEVVVQVLRADDGSIATNVVITREGVGAKYGAATFSNGYNPPAKPDVKESPAPQKQASGGLPKLGDGTALWILALIAAAGIGLSAWWIVKRS